MVRNMKNWTEEFKNLLTDDEVLEKYRRTKYFPLLEGRPEALFCPERKREILQIIKFAQKNKVPIIPYSSEWDFFGSSLALEGGIIIDLRNLKQIEKVRECFDGMSADIEPGVSFRELDEYLTKYNLRSLQPLRVPADTSILSTYYGRNPVLEANKYGYHQDWMILTYQMAISKGIFIGMGSEGLEAGGDPGDYPFSPRADLGRMFLAGLGSFGILSRVTVKLKYRPERYNFLYAECNSLEPLLEKMRQICLRTEAGQIVLIADPSTLTGYIAGSKQEYSEMKEKLPNWMGIIGIAGDDAQIDVEKADLLEVADRVSLNLTEQAPITSIDEILQKEFRVSENIGKYFDFAPHLRIEFYTTAGNLERIRSKMDNFLKSVKVPEENIGFMMNSLEMGRTYFCEYDLYYETRPEKIDPSDLLLLGELNLRDLYEQSYKNLITANAVINVPRNKIIAKLIYPRVPHYYEMMRILKYCMDPNNIMHPSIIFSGEGGIDPKTVQIPKEVTQ